MSLSSMRTLPLVLAGVSLLLGIPSTARAQDCAKSPDEAWRLAREAVATKDAGKVMMRLSPAYQTRNSIEASVGSWMVLSLSALSESKSAAAAKATATKEQLLNEHEALLKKYKAMSIKEMGPPLLRQMEEPRVRTAFAQVDHIGFAREMQALFEKIAAARFIDSGEPPALDEYVVGSGNLNVPLSGLNVTGETARATSATETMLFRRINGCWLVDGRE